MALKGSKRIQSVRQICLKGRPVSSRIGESVLFPGYLPPSRVPGRLFQKRREIGRCKAGFRRDQVVYRVDLINEEIAVRSCQKLPGRTSSVSRRGEAFPSERPLRYRETVTNYCYVLRHRGELRLIFETRNLCAKPDGYYHEIERISRKHILIQTTWKFYKSANPFFIQQIEE